ncbi:LytTR family transcriptional regulator DNA-binding domain-containing protein [Brevibacillus sp. M2.1A]|uniref:LytTR family transcriptional regulator DNA-binding domain-containing protein n=1 Tax=Brevibacillus sp. M2.1A TaxID=2738980 RepID=UPI00156B1E0F|nr:LytTR family transcriptional regulator DNA-binding domain-containing protein [Brevibacillus sp. M2.1A]MCC8435508.1 LytTR family transcriptional regulator DNA-binding domain-containing protein [Brevibacillus sp. M2.1A]
MTSPRIFCVRVDKKGDEFDYMEFDLTEDIFYVSIYRPKKNKDGIFVLHTRYGMYHWVNTLEGAKRQWRNYGFVALDSVNVVNVNKISFVDPVAYKVYFEDGSSTTVSSNRMELIEHLPQKTAQ